MFKFLFTIELIWSFRQFSERLVWPIKPSGFLQRNIMDNDSRNLKRKMNTRWRISSLQILYCASSDDGLFMQMRSLIKCMLMTVEQNLRMNQEWQMNILPTTLNHELNPVIYIWLHFQSLKRSLELVSSWSKSTRSTRESTCCPHQGPVDQWQMAGWPLVLIEKPQSAALQS